MNLAFFPGKKNNKKEKIEVAANFIMVRNQLKFIILQNTPKFWSVAQPLMNLRASNFGDFRVSFICMTSPNFNLIDLH